jgi:hypothetical protein
VFIKTSAREGTSPMTSHNSHGSTVPATAVAAPQKSPPTSYELLEAQLRHRVDRRTILAVLRGRKVRGLARLRAEAAVRELGFEPGELAL